MSMFLLQTAFLLLLCFLGGYFVARLGKRRLCSLVAPRYETGGGRDASGTDSRDKDRANNGFE